MSKFSLNEITANQPTTPTAEAELSSRISNFRPTTPHRIDIATVDAAAAPHGFTSREPTPPKRRRVAPREPRPNNMGIRLSNAEKERFVAFADKNQLPNYSEVIVRLLDIAEAAG